jgi:hypothetical protein
VSSPRKNPLAAPPPKFHVGDRVLVPFGAYTYVGTVVEDRGPLGVGGRRLYGVTYDRHMPELSYSEIPEEELEPADGTPARN